MKALEIHIPIFIVDDHAINRIISYLRHGALYRDRDIEQLGRSLDLDLTSDADLEALAIDMWELNVNAFFQVNTNKTDYKHSIFHFERISCPTPVVAYKQLQCLTYQCNNGDVPKTALYQALNRYKETLAEFIVAGLDEYKRAYWG